MKIKIYNQQSGKYEFAKEPILPFDIKGDFYQDKWQTIQNKNYATFIKIRLINEPVGECFYVSKITVCKGQKNRLYIHIERLKSADEHKKKHEFDYITAINDSFDLTEGGDEWQVRIIIYNNRPVHNDVFFLDCNEQSSSEQLNFPNPKMDAFNKIKFVSESNEDPGHDPDIVNGNILVGKN